MKRKVDAALASSDVRYLHIPLFNAERAWAYAKMLKKEVWWWWWGGVFGGAGRGVDGGGTRSGRGHLTGRVACVHLMLMASAD